MGPMQFLSHPNLLRISNLADLRIMLPDFGFNPGREVNTCRKMKNLEEPISALLNLMS
jgi:hypothetical protein